MSNNVPGEIAQGLAPSLYRVYKDWPNHHHLSILGMYDHDHDKPIIIFKVKISGKFDKGKQNDNVVLQKAKKRCHRLKSLYMYTILYWFFLYQYLFLHHRIAKNPE